MIKRLLFVFASLALVLGVLIGMNPWLPGWVVLWFGCPGYNGLSGYCGNATGEFIFIRSATFIILCWITYRIGAWICHKDE